MAFLRTSTSMLSQMDGEGKSLANGSKMTAMDDAFNDQHKKQVILCSCPSPSQDLKQLDSAKEEQDAVTLGELLLEDCITDIGYHQPPELAASSPRLWTLFHWNMCFKVWKKLSINHQPSPTCVPNNTRSSFVNFSLSDLRKATNKFRNENLIGRGGFADVYRGCLKDGQLIAVKRLSKGTHDERISSFLSELGIMAHVNHHNTAKLIGFGVEGGMHLVFQLSPLGDLGSILHGSNNANLDWSKRYKIIIGIADGLLYLHGNCPRRIIHRDIKAGNILLTENFEPQICDFGLAKWLPEQCTHFNVSKFEGTFGYFAPEYLMHGVVDEKTDAYAFGILLLEIITGRRALDRLHESIVSWAKPLYEANNIRDLVDPSLGDNYDREQMDRVVLTASLCVEQFPILRPSMSQVAILLRGDDFLQEAGLEIVQEHNAS